MLNWFFKKESIDSFKMITNGRCGTIVFEENSRRCELYYEMSGVPEYHILISFDTLKYWTIPKGSLISHHEKDKLRFDLIDWLANKGLKAEL